MEIPSRTYDVAIIGAGTAGCAVARELANAGYSTVLIDRGDFGAATSSRSSRNLYCGLSYLKPDYPLWQMPFRPGDLLQRLNMVKVTMNARAEMVKIMPERLLKLPYIFPYRKRQTYPAWIIDLAFRMLMLFQAGVPLAYRRIPAHEAMSNGLVAGLAPGVHAVGYIEEYQYQWAERICVDTALEAERCGARLLTYVRVTAIDKTNEGWSLATEATIAGRTGPGMIRAKKVINATGPWIDEMVPPKQAGREHVAKLKGVNLLVKLPSSFRGTGLQTFSRQAEGLGLYLMPWGDYHFIGPTESRETRDPDDVRVTEGEISYLIDETNAIFPDLNLKRDDVIHGWCGVRPWSTDGNRRPIAPARLREHEGKPGIFSITGVTIMLNRHAGRLARRRIAKTLRPSGQPLTDGAMRQTGRSFDPDRIDAAQVTEILRSEHVFTLSDLLRRRLPFGWDPDMGLSKMEEVSRIAAETLGWSEVRRQAECAAYRTETEALFLMNGQARLRSAGA